jgi:hypothetical protein
MRTRRTAAVRLAVAAGVAAVLAVTHTGSAYGGGGQFTCDGRQATIVGTNGPDDLQGTSGADVIVGLGGDDRIDGAGGPDRLCGEADQASGVAGNDVVHGGPGVDILRGKDGRDHLFGDGGPDVVHGGPGSDFLIGSGGGDQMFGNAGNDRLYGQPGPDRLFGGSGRDRLSGGFDNDRLNGGVADNVCDGGPGTDGGVQCQVHDSMALLSFQSVSLHRTAAGSYNCTLHVMIANQGSEPATDVKVEATVKTTALPAYGAEPLLQGSAEIPDPQGPLDVPAHYFAILGFPFPGGDLLKYVIRVHNGGTSVDTTSSEFGIKCSD